MSTNALELEVMEEIKIKIIGYYMLEYTWYIRWFIGYVFKMKNSLWQACDGAYERWAITTLQDIGGNLLTSWTSYGWNVLWPTISIHNNKNVQSGGFVMNTSS